MPLLTIQEKPKVTKTCLFRRAGRIEEAGKITGEFLPADTARFPDGCKGQFPELLVIGSPNSVPGK